VRWVALDCEVVPDKVESIPGRTFAGNCVAAGPCLSTPKSPIVGKISYQIPKSLSPQVAEGARKPTDPKEVCEGTPQGGATRVRYRFPQTDSAVPRTPGTSTVTAQLVAKTRSIRKGIGAALCSSGK
jgi:hypothetical protein